jgi:hypothetical protein
MPRSARAPRWTWPALFLLALTAAPSRRIGCRRVARLRRRSREPQIPPLSRITGENVGTLRSLGARVKWTVGIVTPGGGTWSGAGTSSPSCSGAIPDWRDNDPPNSTTEATPLMVEACSRGTPTSVGAAYVPLRAVALDLRSESYEAGTTTMSLRWNQRGVAYWRDGDEARVLWGTGDGYLVAVDAKTGQPVPGFGDGGRVDLMQGLPRATRGARDYLNALTYSVQSPPIVVGDVVVTPASISSLV